MVESANINATTAKFGAFTEPPLKSNFMLITT
jgi:hypothetical protein